MVRGINPESAAPESTNLNTLRLNILLRTTIGYNINLNTLSALFISAYNPFRGALPGLALLPYRVIRSAFCSAIGHIAFLA